MIGPSDSGDVAPTPRVDSSPSDATSGLLIVAGERTCSTYVIGERDLVIGRARHCDVRIEHPALSRQHAVLRVGRPCAIQDLGSTNGTRVAGTYRHGGDPVVLRANDSFHIGPFSFVLVSRTPREDVSLSARDALRVIDPSPEQVPPLVRDLAASTTNVIILGETGVGKEVLAETLHQLSGRPGPLMRINCAALNESLLESELFGHEKGAFTGAGTQRIGLLEAAAAGTVFLDEVGELPLGFQAKLLRAIEHREVLRIGATRPVRIDVRFVAATNRDLPAEVDAGRFRRDLYFRLDGVTVWVPPLRERRSLIAQLALRFLAAAREQRGTQPHVAPEVLHALQAYDWPGNVRELRAVIDRAVLLARGGEIAVRHLAFARVTDAPNAPAPAVTSSATDDDPDLRGLDAEQRREREKIVAALEASAGNQTRAARQLGMPRTTLNGKLVLYRIPRPRT